MSQKEINDIIKACIGNKSLAQEKLYKHYFGLMFSICKNYTCGRQDTISLVNEGFLKIFLHLKSYDQKKGNFESWAKKIMTNNCIDHARKEQSRIKLIDIDTTPQAANMATSHKEFIGEEVLEIVKQLPPGTQKIFSLHVFNGYSHKEISKLMNITESTSRWHVMEARRNLKKNVQKLF